MTLLLLVVGHWYSVVGLVGRGLLVIGCRSSVFGQGYHRVQFNFNAVLLKTKNGDKFVLISTAIFSNVLNIKQ